VLLITCILPAFLIFLRPMAGLAEDFEMFGYIAVPVPPNPDLRPFTKWNDMVSRMARERGWEHAECGSLLAECPQTAWRTLLKDAARLPKTEQMLAVNRFVNTFEYVSDKVNWGGIDYWETPQEFFYKGGECKDYAIAKYFTLRALGWPINAMWIIVLQDMNLNATHAVLAVKHNGKTMVLDSQISEIVEDGRIHHYRPIFGLDEGGWVLFRSR
jgi:predicted transglutaminase-like cysteine proteinase